MTRFTSDHISDAKRVVRGEQYLYARRLLRARSVDRTAPRVLILPGGSPREEIELINELWPRPSAHITAVDSEKDCVELASKLGVARAVHSTLAEFSGTLIENRKVKRSTWIPEALAALAEFGMQGCTHYEFANATKAHQMLEYGEGVIARAASGLLGRLQIKGFAVQTEDKRWSISTLGQEFLANERATVASHFDLVTLDLCGGVSSVSRALLRSYARALTPRGCILFTFSYGRDVGEAFRALVRGGDLTGEVTVPTRSLMKKGMPDTVAGRLCFLSENGGLRLRSVMLYKGKEAPMCSSLWQRWHTDKRRVHQFYWPHDLRAPADISFSKVGNQDLQNLIVHPDIAKLYGCPEERVIAVRRSAAAQRAVATRKRSNGAAASIDVEAE